MILKKVLIFQWLEKSLLIRFLTKKSLAQYLLYIVKQQYKDSG